MVRLSVRLASFGVVLLMWATLVSAMAAANTVPTSKAYDKTRAITPNDLKPVECASLNLTALMDILSNLVLGFQTAGTPLNLGYCLIGVFLGTLIGVLPGLGPVATIAMHNQDPGTGYRQVLEAIAEAPLFYEDAMPHTGPHWARLRETERASDGEHHLPHLILTRRGESSGREPGRMDSNHGQVVGCVAPDHGRGICLSVAERHRALDPVPGHLRG